MVGWKDAIEIGKWAWENRAGLKPFWDGFQRWLRRSRILVIGPGGTGKTTLARILSGRFDWLRDAPWRYDEDVGVTRFRLKADPAAEIVVMPGQEHRRHTSWAGVGKDLAKGVYHGVILVSAYGYHSLSGIGYKQHRLYEPERDKDVFLRKYLEANRHDEIACLARLSAFIKECSRRLWLVSLVTKQDLWRSDETSVEKWYREGEYGKEIAEISQMKGPTFAHEPHFLSLLIGNLVTQKDETLAKNVQGYDHRAQVESVRRLFEIIDGATMGQREVKAAVELSATEAAERLLLLLKEYAAKLASLSERSAEVMEKFVTPASNSSGKVQYVLQGKNVATPAALEAGRLICLHDTLEEPVTQLAHEASGLIEHATLESHLRSELKSRLDELEEHGRYSVVMTTELVSYLTAQQEQAELVRKLIEQTGRYKAPF